MKLRYSHVIQCRVYTSMDTSTLIMQRNVRLQDNRSGGVGLISPLSPPTNKSCYTEPAHLVLSAFSVAERKGSWEQ